MVISFFGLLNYNIVIYIKKRFYLPNAIDYAVAISTLGFYFTNYFLLGISPPSFPIFQVYNK